MKQQEDLPCPPKAPSLQGGEGVGDRKKIIN